MGGEQQRRRREDVTRWWSDCKEYCYCCGCWHFCTFGALNWGGGLGLFVVLCEARLMMKFPSLFFFSLRIFCGGDGVCACSLGLVEVLYSHIPPPLLPQTLLLEYRCCIWFLIFI